MGYPRKEGSQTSQMLILAPKTARVAPAAMQLRVHFWQKVKRVTDWRPERERGRNANRMIFLQKH